MRQVALEELDPQEREEIARRRAALRAYTRRQPWWTPTEKLILALDAGRVRPDA